jgi:hypothetical protein
VVESGEGHLADEPLHFEEIRDHARPRVDRATQGNLEHVGVTVVARRP